MRIGAGVRGSASGVPRPIAGRGDRARPGDQLLTLTLWKNPRGNAESWFVRPSHATLDKPI